ncbi:hypothetical protein M5689_000583 [Euphorbia peplus]|nr:hypothetical protein M5689_000583 [Euphorbia peplus]
MLTHIFMAHPIAINLLKHYYLTIGIDSTYKTNRYKWPLVEMVGMTPCNKNFLIAYVLMHNEKEESYRWALERLRELLPTDKNPHAITTDRELVLLKPVRELFPHSNHLLCTWHINKDVQARVTIIFGDANFAEQFKNGRWYRIIHSTSIEDYTAQVRSLRANFSGENEELIKYLSGTWLVHKEKFVEAWTNEVLHFGNVTTCRVEAQHAGSKKWLHTSTGGLHSVWAKLHKKMESEHTAIR